MIIIIKLSLFQNEHNFLLVYSLTEIEFTIDIIFQSKYFVTIMLSFVESFSVNN